MPRKRAKRARGMGSVYFRGGTWAVRWREQGRRRFKSGFPDENTARLVLHKVIAEVARGEAGMPPEPTEAAPLRELAVDWLKRRETTHRSHRDDASRWKVHLEPFLGHRRPDDVTPADLRRFAEVKLVGKKLSSSTIGLCVRLLSSLYTDLVERGLATQNPAKALPRGTRRLLRSQHDPRSVPFLERQDDIRRVFLALPQLFATFFALGVLAGLRPGECLAIEWGDIDLEARRIWIQRQVRHGRLGPPKSGKGRLVPIADLLAKVLAEWKLATGGQGQLFRPVNRARGGRKGSPPRFLNLHTVHAKLATALEACGLPSLTLYQCTRHTYASQFVIAGGSLAHLREILGHSSVLVTERYGHLRSSLLRPADLPALTVDLSRPGGAVIDLSARRDEKRTVGHALATEAVDGPTKDDVSTHGN